MKLKTIVISQARSALASILDPTLQLSEDAHSLSEVPVSMKEVSLQKVSVSILRSGTPGKFAEILIANARLATE
jgi:hypothetical protein